MDIVLKFVQEPDENSAYIHMHLTLPSSCCSIFLPYVYIFNNTGPVYAIFLLTCFTCSSRYVANLY